MAKIQRLICGERFGEGLGQLRRGGAQPGIFGYESAANLMSQGEEARILRADAVASGAGQDRSVRDASQFSLEKAPRLSQE